MSKKYLTAEEPAIIINDLYLAAFLHCVGCTLEHVQRNERRRMSFVFVGKRVQELREAYRTGPVKLDMRSFRESLFHIRRLMDLPCRSPEAQAGGEPEQRSLSHVNNGLLQTEPQY